ncbi:MAG: hypothetical protein HY400_00530, partial [Elusimicrobia bacterium]|nr:hypothetical protein [Elusimicrobiota bacterium]
MAASFRNRPQTAGLPGEWLSSFSASARDAGLGNASTALSGAAAPYANPAGMRDTQMGEVSFMIAPMFSGGQYQSFSLVHPVTLNRRLGVTFLRLGSGEAERTSVLGESQGSFNENNLAFLLSYSQEAWEILDLGFSVKAIRQSLAEFSATGVGADLGAQIHFFEDGLIVGAAVQNILPPKLKLKEETDQFPRFFRGGLARKGQVFGRPLLASFDLMGGGNVLRWAAGIEGQPFLSGDIPLFLRLGINHREYT